LYTHTHDYKTVNTLRTHIVMYLVVYTRCTYANWKDDKTETRRIIKVRIVHDTIIGSLCTADNDDAEETQWENYVKYEEITEYTLLHLIL